MSKQVAYKVTTVLYPLEVLRLLYVPKGLTLKNSMFYPQSARLYLACSSEQRQIISLYSIYWFVFKNECI